MNKYLTELIGTFFLCLVAGLVVIREFPIPVLPIGAALMVMVYMGGHISGGHYNPAVSLAAMMRGALPTGQFLPYLASQFLGAIAAGMRAVAVEWGYHHPESGGPNTWEAETVIAHPLDLLRHL